MVVSVADHCPAGPDFLGVHDHRLLSLKGCAAGPRVLIGHRAAAFGVGDELEKRMTGGKGAMAEAEAEKALAEKYAAKPVVEEIASGSMFVLTQS